MTFFWEVRTEYAATFRSAATASITIEPVSKKKDVDAVLELFRLAATNRECGASEIEHTLINRLLDHRAVLQPESLRLGARVLAAGQPAMANLRSLAAAAEKGPPERALDWLEQRRQVLRELPQLLTANAWSWIKNAQVVLTISRSTAVADVVEGAWHKGWQGSVVVFDGTASGCGPEQAKRLSMHGEVLSQPDATVMNWLDGDGVLVVVGADGVGPGSFVNSTGTQILLQGARDRGVEGLLVADTAKDVGQRIFDELVAVIPEFRDPLGRSWPVFEVIPLEFVTTRIDEKSTVS